jgi:plastocyanin
MIVAFARNRAGAGVSAFNFPHGRRLALMVLGVVVSVTSIAPHVEAAAITISITSTLDPATVTVPPNTVVTFANQDGARHRMRTTSGPAEFDSGNIEAGQSYSVTLAAVGTYSYRDERNTGNASYFGQIVVSSQVPATTVVGTSTTQPPPLPTAVAVSIGDRVFSPVSMTVAVGGVVTWTNNDSRSHTVTANGGSFDSGILAPGATWSHTFAGAGTFAYFCELHPDMVGTVTVAAQGGSATPTATAAPTTTATPPVTTVAPTITTSPVVTTTLPPGSPPPTTAAVMIMSNQFTPNTVTITAGGTVTWTNHDAVPHTVTAAAAGGFDSGTLRQNGTFSNTFASPGTYAYGCDFHPEMVATVIVLAAGATVPPATTSGTNSGGSSTTSANGSTSTASNGAATGSSNVGTANAGGGGANQAVTSGSGGSASGTALSTSATVAISGNRFVQSTVTIAVGGTVTWTNQDTVPHTVTASDASFDSGLLRRAESWSHTFGSPGTYTYLCSLHPTMTGIVVVATPDDPSPAVVTHSSTSHAAQSTTSGATSGASAAGQAVGAAGGGDVPQAAPGSATVSMLDNQFQPSLVTVAPGGAVTWTNADTLPHTVTAVDGSFDSDIMMPGDSYSHQFGTAGTVAYRCTLHPGMTGTVVVSETVSGAVDAGSAGGQGGVAQPGAPGLAVPAESPDRVVSITGSAFPAVIVLSAGHSITWVNDDTIDHDVVAADERFDSGVLTPGGRFTFTFDEPGVVRYTCDLHKHMSGAVIVLPAEAVELSNRPTVAVTDIGFEPADLTVRQGETVLWAFGGLLPHTVTAADGSFASEMLKPGSTFEHTFDTLGTFSYACTLHPAMVGTITVVEADAEIVASAVAVPGPVASAPPPAGPVTETNGAGSGMATPVVVGLGIGGGLLAATLLALAVAAATRRPRATMRHA